MLKNLFFIAVLSVLFTACGDSRATAQKEADHTPKKETSQEEGTAITNPVGSDHEAASFILDVKFTERLKKKLAGTKEVIVIDVAISGKPKDKTTDYFKENGFLTIATDEIEITEEGVFTIAGIKIKQKDLDALENPDNYDITVNFYSGRKEFKSNIVSAKPSAVITTENEVSENGEFQVTLDLI